MDIKLTRLKNKKLTEVSSITEGRMKQVYPIMNRWAVNSIVLVMIVSAGFSLALSQPQIIYHSFSSGTARSGGGNAVVTSLLGQSIFGVSRSGGISVLSGYTAYVKGALLSIKKGEAGIPSEFVVYQNYPNPFNPATTIRYGLPLRSIVTITIYNILGQKIEQVVKKEQSEGTYEILWNAGVASGIYFYRIEAVSVMEPKTTFAQLKKMVLLR